MRFKKYLLNEKTARIGADVDMIYKLSFLKYEKIFKKDDLQLFIKEIQSTNNIGNGQFIFNTFNSSILKSRDCRMAHDINPINIQCGLLNGNFYRPIDKMIQISLNMSATNILIMHKIKNIDDLSKVIKNSDILERIQSEFDGKSIKGSIYHELSHWIDDSKHNFHITKMIKKASELQSTDIMKKDGSVVFTDYEIEAQVHAIKQLKREFNKSWDFITWNDIIQFKPSFDVIKNQLKQSKPIVQKNYYQRLIKRLNREKLLGKLMQKTFKKYMLQ